MNCGNHPNHEMELDLRLPEWLKNSGHRGVHNTKRLMRSFGLSTVCEEARCPNVGECFSRPTAAFMILGSKCTRNCGFCSVASAAPDPPDLEEPARVAMAAKEMGLRYVVITSVTRDDLYDGGAGHFAATVSHIRRCLPQAKVEILTPDFRGDLNSLEVVIHSKPDVFNHNIETVPRLYPSVRPHADYTRSLFLLEYVKKTSPGIYTKSGLMLGLGEEINEVIKVLKDLRSAGCDLLTIGQYLRPSKMQLPVVEYISPDMFESLRITALSLGFRFVASAPQVRSSMNAEEMYYN
ncbi:MAG: lipoyl synthase [Thermodesulfovibrionales bacterium]|nr:lipoyl synthase [Thermodesulfovibrionales bacterium]